MECSYSLAGDGDVRNWNYVHLERGGFVDFFVHLQRAGTDCSQLWRYVAVTLNPLTPPYFCKKGM